MAIYQAAFDASGNEPTHSPIFVFGGFIATADQWAQFSDAWQAELDRDIRLAYFKMSEAASLTGEFHEDRGWTEIDRDKRVLAFARIIRQFAKIRVSAWIRHADWTTHIASLPAPVRRLSQHSPYTHLALQTILAVMVFQEHHGISDPVEFIFDTEGTFEDELHQNWPSFRYMVENQTRRDLKTFLGSRPVFKDEKKFVPIQAGDLYAWQVRNSYLENHRIPKQTIRIPRNQVLQTLWPLPAINREMPTNEIVRLRAHLLSAGERFAELYPGIPLVPPIVDKKERQKAHRNARKFNPPWTPDDSSSNKEEPS